MKGLRQVQSQRNEHAGDIVAGVGWPYFGGSCGGGGCRHWGRGQK